MNVLKTRLHPFEKLPDEVLIGESRATVHRTFALLRDQLLAKTSAKGVKAVLKDFIARSPMLDEFDEFDEELAHLAEAARTYLEKHKSKPRPRIRGG